jgi:hypothetical protein
MLDGVGLARRVFPGFGKPLAFRHHLETNASGISLTAGETSAGIASHRLRAMSERPHLTKALQSSRQIRASAKE